jgi:hypothetical protein
MVANLHHLDADLDISFHFNADPDPTSAPHFKLICDHWPTDPPRLQFEPSRLHCERPRPSVAPF